MFTINDYNINDSLVNSLFAIDQSYPYMKENFYRSLSSHKLAKVMWLYEGLTAAIDLNDNIKTVNWYLPGFSYYQSIMAKKLKFADVTFFDYDPSVSYVNYQSTKHLNGECKHVMIDVVFDKEFIENVKVDLVINQSCSSTVDQFNINDMYDSNVLLAYQGSGSYKRGNINVFSDINNFIESTGITRVVCSAKRKISDETYYMVIGFKD